MIVTVGGTVWINLVVVVSVGNGLVTGGLVVSAMTEVEALGSIEIVLSTNVVPNVSAVGEVVEAVGGFVSTGNGPGTVSFGGLVVGLEVVAATLVEVMPEPGFEVGAGFVPGVGFVDTTVTGDVAPGPTGVGKLVVLGGIVPGVEPTSSGSCDTVVTGCAGGVPPSEGVEIGT